MKAGVAIARCQYYDEEYVYKTVRNSVDLLGGLGKFIKPGNKVLLKPNLLSSYPPQKHITTHPFLVGAVVRLLKELGTRVYLGDSPGIDTVKALANYGKVLKITGISAIADKYDAECIQFKNSILLPREKGHLFKEIRVAKEVLDMDNIINLPKLKTHIQMYLTLCVKNMFGCVVGPQKAQWHLRAGTDFSYFARMLVELYESVKPTLNILDGIIGMEGDGPAAGRLRNTGLIIASADGVALDRVVCEILGGNPDSFFILNSARQLNCGETNLSGIEILGENLDSVRIKGFRFPTFINVSDIGPKVLRKYIHFLTTSRPLVLKEICKMCGVCQEVCPAKAIIKNGNRLYFDYEKCIGCFCCAELCKYHGIKIHTPILGRVLNRLKS